MVNKKYFEYEKVISTPVGDRWEHMNKKNSIYEINKTNKTFKITKTTNKKQTNFNKVYSSKSEAQKDLFKKFEKEAFN